MVLALLLSTFLMAQKTDSWKIYHNRKEVASFKFKEGADERRLVLLNRALDEPGFLIITYTPVSKQSDWVRQFIITDSTDKELKKIENTAQLRIHNSDVARLLERRDRIRIYTLSIPKDPALAAVVRVRRILLCTIYTR